jgi:hypothetical protein
MNILKFTVLVWLTCLTQLSLAQEKDSSKWDIAIRAGIAYNVYEPFGNGNFKQLVAVREIVPTINPIVGASLIKENIGKDNCCNFIRVELSVTRNKSEFTTFYPQTPFKESITGRASIFYTHLSGQYGWIIGERLRLGPTLGLLFRSGSIIQSSEKAALAEAGIFDLNSNQLNSSIKSLDINLGAGAVFKISEALFLQGNINYGLIPQIRLTDLPPIYQTNAQLSVGYILKNK